MFKSRISNFFILLIIIALFIFIPVAFTYDSVHAEDLLTEIKDRGYLKCGINHNNLPGFAVQVSKNKFEGYDIDYCRAIAAAIFGMDNKVEYFRVSSNDRFQNLRDGLFDVLVRVTTHTLSRDSALVNGGESGDFAPVIFYDGQGFLSSIPWPDNGENALSQLALILDGSSVCVESNTTTYDNLIDFGIEYGVTFSIVETSTSIYYDYNDGLCEFATSDQSALLSSMSIVTEPGMVLPVTISKEPLAPVVRQGGESENFEDVVRWVVYATFFAEERGISKNNVSKVINSHSINSEERRFLGIEGDLGVKLGIDNNWAFSVIKIVGNHKDIFERNLSPLGLSPGPNQPPPYGLMFSPPFS
jgi:general L-amino acid transport system substrate-binding protein